MVAREAKPCQIRCNPHLFKIVVWGRGMYGGAVSSRISASSIWFGTPPDTVFTKLPLVRPVWKEIQAKGDSLITYKNNF